MPSDSFPGTAALYTGATPRTTGIWYDDTWDRSLFAEGCMGPPGFEVHNDETIDVNSTALDGGGAFNLSTLSYRMTSWGSCAYNFPHNFLRVKSIFEVVRENGGFTKLTEKHPAYEIFNGPSGTGIYVRGEICHADACRRITFLKSMPLTRLSVPLKGMTFSTGRLFTIGPPETSVRDLICYL